MRWLPWSSGLPLFLIASPALAQTTGPSHAIEADTPEQTAPSGPTDTNAGHLTLFGLLGYAWPYGRLGPATTIRSLSSGGLTLGLDGEFGVSRTVSVGLWAGLDLLSSRSSCDCTLRSFAGGPLVRYHLAQGIRFDPWVAVGAGVRSTTVDAGSTTRYAGIDWLHAALGGDWYAASGVALGPMLAADFGTFVSPESAFHWQLTAGLRVGLDFPGR